MKRTELLRRLKKAGLTLEEGANHTKVLDASGKVISIVGRHTEILETMVKVIEKQTGVKLR